ncbi:type I-E CRISPR-associated protein Cas6/Cse3/CasE [Streptomyces sp. MS1.AVA.3]|uniref:type I-E CRISPR-associated protein Cas6/Cse3/CasE n=1 Tax=Streptomyces decoyicus TaxID=249567 RepID=UPI0030C24367
MTDNNTPQTARFVAHHSILQFDTQHPFALKSMLDVHEMHRTVMCGFYGWVPIEEQGPRATMGVLSTWTVDLNNNRLVLVIQHRTPADWSQIPTDALVDKPKTLPVDMTIRAGDTYGFRTVVNPIHHLSGSKTPDGRSRRLAHKTPTHVNKWFTDRLQAPGQPPTAPNGTTRIGATTDPTKLAVRMLPTVGSAHPKRRNLKVARAEIAGQLTVTDPTTLTSTLAAGIGKARAYSTGLLLLR